MLCYIDIEHDLVLDDLLKRDDHLSMRTQEKLRFECLSDLPCLLLRYTFIRQGWIEHLNPVAVIISGSQTDWSYYAPDDFDALLTFIRSWRGPMLGICAGHQLIAHAFGARTGPIRPLLPDEYDPRPDYGPGLLKELGVKQIEVLQPDPLFDSVPTYCDVIEDHYWEVKSLPDRFRWLARSATTEIQAYSHRERPLYGTQFHPERYTENVPHGQQLLQNFFYIARQYCGR